MAGGARVEGVEDLVDRGAPAILVAGVDDDRQAEVDGDLDLAAKARRWSSGEAVSR